MTPDVTASDASAGEGVCVCERHPLWERLFARAHLFLIDMQRWGFDNSLRTATCSYVSVDIPQMVLYLTAE